LQTKPRAVKQYGRKINKNALKDKNLHMDFWAFFGSATWQLSLLYTCLPLLIKKTTPVIGVPCQPGILNRMVRKIQNMKNNGIE